MLTPDFFFDNFQGMCREEDKGKDPGDIANLQSLAVGKVQNQIEKSRLATVSSRATPVGSDTNFDILWRSKAV